MANNSPRNQQTTKYGSRQAQYNRASNRRTTEKTQNALARKADPAKQDASDVIKGERAMAFTKINYILVLIGVAIVVIGFLLMTGGSSTTEAYNPDIFSVRRTRVAPLVCLFGFVFIVFAILFHKKAASAKPAEQDSQEA